MSGSDPASEPASAEPDSDLTADEQDPAPVAPMSPPRPTQVLAFGVLPAAAVLLAGFAGFLKWQDYSGYATRAAAGESVAAARDATVAMLSYQPDTVEAQLGAARDRLTGSFLDEYTNLVNDVVIPGAKQKRISAAVEVPAAASVSAEPSHAVVLVFVDQTVTIGTDAPTSTASSVRVTLDRVEDRWLVSGFDPV